MSKSITFDRRVTGSGICRNPDTQVVQSFSIGAGLVPSCDVSYSYGTGDFEVNAWYFERVTLGVGDLLSLDLRGGLADGEGNAVSFAAVKSFNVWVVDPDHQKSVRVGPQGEANANRLWFGGTGATVYEVVTAHLLKDSPLDGWPVAAGSTDIVAISNPAGDGTADDEVTVVIAILGIAP